MTENTNKDAAKQESTLAAWSPMQTAWQLFEQADKKSRERALRKAAIMRRSAALEKDGVSHNDIAAKIKHEFPGRGSSRKALWEMRKRIDGHPPENWPPILLDNYKGNISEAPFSEDMKRWLVNEWGTTSKPRIAPIYRRARVVAQERGLSLPSCKTVSKWIKSLPRDVQVYLREGKKAAFHNHPAVDRIYSGMPVHAEWVADGHRMDIKVDFSDGKKPDRPMLLAWMETRTRKVLGYRIGRNEDTELIRLSFKSACENTGYLIPDVVFTDNGRGFSSKALTGGAETRFRFKKFENEVRGAFTMLGIEPRFAMPGHGQSKHIERWFGLMAEVVKRKEFVGAYCGNSVSNKPEDLDERKTISIDRFKEVIDEEIALYNARPGHRGEGMNNRSSNEVYDALMAEAEKQGRHFRVVTCEQLRISLLEPVLIKLAKKDNTIRILKNRYWCDDIKGLDPKLKYEVRYDPWDASKSVYLYRQNGAFICEVPLFQAIGYQDKESMKKAQAERRRSNRATKERAEALKGEFDARLWNNKKPESDRQPKPSAPSPKVVSLVTDLPMPKKCKAQTPAKPAISTADILKLHMLAQPAQVNKPPKREFAIDTSDLIAAITNNVRGKK